MEISHTMTISKTLTDLCAIRKKNKNKNTFGTIAYNILIVKEPW